METTLNRDLAGVDVPPFSYTGIAHTFRNSPFNEYPYAMARLRWFTSSIGPGWSDESSLLHEIAGLNAHFTYLQVSDAGLVDAILDTIFRSVTGGEEREKRNLGPHEPGIGRWVNEDEFNERYLLDLPASIGRQELFDRVSERLRIETTGDATVDEIYLYPPDYGDEPDGEVRHLFRIFGHSDSDDSAVAGARLRKAVETVLGEIRQSVT